MLTDQQRAVVRQLANGLFPLEKWIATKAYDPISEHGADAPWRTGGRKLRVEHTGAIEFLEAIIRDSSGTESLLTRWRQLDGDPFRFCPIADVQSWRVDRGLEGDRKDVRFGAVEAQNVWPGGGSQRNSSTHPESRRQFYQRYLDPLVETAESRGLATDRNAGWVELADLLFKDECKEWPEKSVGSSSVFVEQLGRDLLYGMMNMTTPASDPHRSALMTELGEHRRPGNAYESGNCDDAIKALQKKIEQRSKKKIKQRSKKK